MLCLLAGGFLLFAALSRIVGDTRFRLAGQPIHGEIFTYSDDPDIEWGEEVIDAHTASGTAVDVTFPVVRYKDPRTGEEYEIVSQQSFAPGMPKIGSQVELLYLPDDPGTAIMRWDIGTMMDYFTGLSLGFIFLVPLGLIQVFAKEFS